MAVKFILCWRLATVIKDKETNVICRVSLCYNTNQCNITYIAVIDAEYNSEFKLTKDTP